MLSVIIATHESERSLVPTLSALIPAVSTGLLGEVVVADAGSRDATAQVADIAGCRLVVSSERLGTRLRAAAASTRAPWLMFLRAGTVLEPGWPDVVGPFLEKAGAIGTPRAAVFRPQPASDVMRSGLAEALAVLRASLAAPKPQHGLLLARALYNEIGGHEADEEADITLLRRIGRRRLARLSARATFRS